MRQLRVWQLVPVRKIMYEGQYRDLVFYTSRIFEPETRRRVGICDDSSEPSLLPYTKYGCLAERIHVVYRAVAAYLKVVRRRKRSSAEGTRGGECERGMIPPLVRGVWGASPEKFLNFERFYVRFNGFFMRLGPDFSRLCHKDISCRMRNRMLDKILFKHSHVFFFFTFFLQHVSLTLFHLCPRRFKRSTFSTDPWWFFKESFSRKDMHTLSLASFQLEHQLRMQASSRFWLR